MRMPAPGGVALTATTLVFALVATARATPVLSQVSDFEGGTIQGWTNGASAADPVNANTGGPAGAGDNFLRVTSRGGGGGGSRLAVYNRSAAWAGNYTTARVTAIGMDVRNLGATDVTLRLAFQETGGSRYATTRAESLPAGGDWRHVVFRLTPADLTRVSGGTATATALTRVFEMRLVHAPTAAFQSPPVVAQVGLDNITAVPEPGTAGALALCAATSLLRRRRPR